jgi:hypothetical protein
VSLSAPAKQLAEDELATKCVTCGAFLYQPHVPAFFLTGEILSKSGINFFKIKNEVISQGFNSRNCGKKKENLQSSIFGFQLVSTNIEG